MNVAVDLRKDSPTFGESFFPYYQLKIKIIVGSLRDSHIVFGS
jgi:dTDP-4-dehydrorhamnose 3,5-epimerase-like enzyme